MKQIRLVIFNESYWNKGLIYSQNILPLKKLSQEIGNQFEVISFTSLLMYFRKRKQIIKTKKELSEEGVIVKDKFVLVYPHSIFFPKRGMIPFLFLNVFLYIILMSWKDRKKDITLFLRSYQTALFFNKFYKIKNNLIFDTRTDWLEENVNLGRIEKGSKTYSYWHKNLKIIVESFRKTLCISEVFKDNLCGSLGVSSQKVEVVYNPIDYNHFNLPKIEHEGVNFLYTGSLGNWNKLENYLEIFCAYARQKGNATFTICTGTVPSIVNAVLEKEEYDDIRELVNVYYNVPLTELPVIYSKCDYGFQLMKSPDSRVGVKFIEYIAAGVTPIINENVQGAVFLAKKYKMGIVLSSKDTISEIVKKIEKGEGRINKSSNEYKAFKDLTDLGMVVQKYSELV